jgi:hypothetical protein
MHKQGRSQWLPLLTLFVVDGRAQTDIREICVWTSWFSTWNFSTKYFFILLIFVTSFFSYDKIANNWRLQVEFILHVSSIFIHICLTVCSIYFLSHLLVFRQFASADLVHCPTLLVIPIAVVFRIFKFINNKVVLINKFHSASKKEQ